MAEVREVIPADPRLTNAIDTIGQALAFDQFDPMTDNSWRALKDQFEEYTEPIGKLQATIGRYKDSMLKYEQLYATDKIVKLQLAVRMPFIKVEDELARDLLSKVLWARSTGPSGFLNTKEIIEQHDEMCQEIGDGNSYLSGISFDDVISATLKGRLMMSEPQAE